MMNAAPCLRRCTRQGWRVDEYRMPNGGVLLVPLVPDWELRQLDLERRQRHLTARERDEG